MATAHIRSHGNQVHFIGDIRQAIQDPFIEALQNAATYPSEIIELHICSPGGTIETTENILYVMRTIGKPIYSYIHNTPFYSGVASAASVIISNTHHRYMYRNATFMIHHARIAGNVIEDEDDILYWMQHTDYDYDVLNDLIKKEKELSATETHQLGFVDEII